MSRSILLLSCILFLSSIERSPTTIDLSPAALKEDVSSLREALEKYHPGLYWYTSKEEFDQVWNNLNSKIDEEMTDDEFFRLLLPVVAKVKCAHTLFYPSDRMISTSVRFPLDLNFIGEKAYIMAGTSSQKLIPRGSELLGINGKSMKEVLSTLLPNIQAQGGNIGWKYVTLENDFQNYYYYLVDHAETFQIEYLDHATGQKKSTIINGSSEERIRNHWKNWYLESDGPPLGLSFHNDESIAIITVKSFNRERLKSYDQKLNKTLDSYFKEISKKGIQNLIIDVRGNEGGNQPEVLYGYIDKNRKGGFKGSVFVLTNERTISAQESFVSIFKYHDRGVTIGRPTAGCAKYLCAGKKRKLVLPNSEFQLDIPMHPSFRVNGDKHEPGKGYLPDNYVEEDIHALLENRDGAMEFALSKIY